MPPSSSSSSSFLLLLLLLLPHLRPTGAVGDADCSGAFRAGQENFVLDAEDAVESGAKLLSTAHVLSEEDCRSACCDDPRCNLALLEPRGTAAAAGAAGAENRTCVLFNCVHRNRFVCRFVNQPGYLSYIRESTFKKHLQGPGEQAPPIAIASRDIVVQPGEAVTLSGIQSLALGDAHIDRYRWTQQSGDAGVLVEKTDLPDQVQLSNLQPGSYVFQLTVTDSNDQFHSAKVTVLVLSPELSSLYCLAPMKVGLCRAAFPRWRYDAAKGECEKFVFGGCKGNNNNFLSDDDCLSACSGVTAATERGVTLPATEECGSVCRPTQLICDSGCCLDRGLECDGVTQCSDGSDENHCSKLNQTLNNLLNIDVNQRKARCAEPPMTGRCRASLTRWYYDPLIRKCSRFTYGGCEGSENNFEEEDKCSKTCRGVTEHNVFIKGVFDRFEADDDETDSGNIALAVCLSVAILALLAVLTYCFLKSRKNRAQRSSATTAAHVVLSEQDTLVYNTTTKPV
ncbi:kunitz-type protease inhibitor 1-like isoform X2 [Sebastes fasciatus]|uniref:kunitz-type protease inhibitor 1-like isoform X2 n=1 Tax=Sebastes fasciatus TaxID=394691 RepID=UPI003D9E94C8